jgi:RNA polymerase subunit RPABC4/transcription elongation factor Spt4
MWLCPYCESVLDDKQTRCAVCGHHKLYEFGETRYCIYCGTKYIVSADTRFCIICGKPL